jgi:hypothetical protein
MVFAIINPLGWLLFALGRVGRSLKIALVIAPLVILGYVVGLHWGPKGVAIGYSAAMTLWVVPHVCWCIRDTAISFWDVVQVLSRPLLAGIVAAVLAFGVQFVCGTSLSSLPRLLLACTILFGTYLGMLVYVMGQKAFYLSLLQGLRGSPSVKEKLLVSV